MRNKEYRFWIVPDIEERMAAKSIEDAIAIIMEDDGAQVIRIEETRRGYRCKADKSLPKAPRTIKPGINYPAW